MNKCILAVGAHADDIEIHCGGTLFKYMDRDYRIVYVMSTNNMCGGKRIRQPDGSWRKTSHYDAEETMAYRKAETGRAARHFNTDPIHLDHPQRHCQMRGPDGTLARTDVQYGVALPPGVPANVPTILTAHEHAPSVQRLADLILEHAPEVVLSHGHAETNPEHHGSFLLTAKAYARAVKGGHRGNMLYWNTHFSALGPRAGAWETWIDTDGHFESKIRALQEHVSQYPPDFDHGADFWRTHDALQGQVCGVKMAEGFTFVNREIVDGPEDGITAELIRNRAEGKPWGLDWADLDPEGMYP